MATENPRWSGRRIAMELAKLGLRVDKNTVAKYMPRFGGRPRGPSQTWATFIRNHLSGTLAIDFFTVPTVTFDVLYVFVVLSLERRLILLAALLGQGGELRRSRSRLGERNPDLRSSRWFALCDR